MAVQLLSHVRYILQSNPTPEQFDTYVRNNPAENLWNEEVGYTPFSASLRFYNLPLALHLIEKGNIGINSQGLTPLFQTCLAAMRKEMSSAELTFIAESLIAAGDNVNQHPVADHIQPVRIDDVVHRFLPKGATPLWLVLECTNSLGLAILLREKGANISERLCSGGDLKLKIVDQLLDIQKGNNLTAQALQVKEIRPLIVDFLPENLQIGIKSHFACRSVDENDLFGLFRQCNSLVKACSSSLKGELPTISSMTDEEIRYYEKIVSYVRGKLEAITAQAPGCYHQLLNSPEDAIVMGNQILPTLQGLTNDFGLLQNRVDTLPRLRARAQSEAKLKKAFWGGVAFAVGAFALFHIFKRLRRA